MKRLFARTAALLSALLICACLLLRSAKADNTPAPAAPTSAPAAAGQQGLSSTGTLISCIGGALTGCIYVLIRRKSGSRGKSYMPKKKK